MNVNISCSLVALSLAMTLSGCASFDQPTPVEKDFGNSVRNMINAQIYNPDAALNPPTEPPTGLDGQKADASLTTFREVKSKGNQVDKPITINIGK